MLWFTLGLLIAVFIGYSFAAWSYLHPQKEPLGLPPDARVIPYETVSFQSKDSTRLEGWFLPKPNAKGVIIVMHGYRSQRAAVLPIAEGYWQAGYSCLLFDFRYHGASGGSCTTVGYKETDDVLAAVSYLAARPDLQGVPIGFHGFSMGGAAGLMAAAKEPRIQAILTDSAYANLHLAISGWFNASFGKGAFLGAPIEWLGALGIGVSTNEVSPEKAVKNLQDRPVFLIHGDADSIVTIGNQKRLIDALGGKAQSWTLPGIEHVRAYDANPTEYMNRSIAFFDAHLKKPPISALSH